MTSPRTVQVLNRLLAIHECSLPMYLGYAAPWTIGHDAAAVEVLSHIVADQKLVADRLGKAILDAGGVVAHSHFPMHFTAYHDLSYDFLVKQMIAAQKKDIVWIKECAEQLAGDSASQAQAEEALGAAKAHLESLEELAQAQLAAGT